MTVSGAWTSTLEKVTLPSKACGVINRVVLDAELHVVTREGRLAFVAQTKRRHVSSVGTVELYRPDCHGGNLDLGASVETFSADDAVFDSSVGCFALQSAER